MIFWYLAILALLTRAVGDFRDPVYALLTAVALGFFWSGFPALPSLKRPVRWLLKWSSWAFVAGLLRFVDPPLSLVLITLILWCFERFGEDSRTPVSRPLLLAGGLYTLWWTVFFQLPPVYKLLTAWSHWYSTIVTSVMSKPLILGPSAMAADLVLLGICALVALYLSVGRKQLQPALIGAVLLFAGHIIYIWMAPTLYALVGHAIPLATTPHLDMPGAYFIYVAFVITLVHRLTVAGAKPTPGAWTYRIATPAQKRLAIAGSAALVLACLVAGVGSFGPANVRVLFLDKHTLDQMVPTFQRYGDNSGGMFGLLPKYLRATGYTVYRQDFTPGILDSVDVVFIANLIDKLPLEERNNLRAFVERGGGLLIIGDHTGTTSIREPTNDILAPSGLQIDFDTAVPLRRSWVSSRNYLFHPLGRSGKGVDAQVWLGASVTPGPRGEPFLVGRGAFSDPGDINNPDRSYLGNLEYDAGEPLGDVVLAAATQWGKGRAVLFGDTSPFQNGSVMDSHALIQRTMRWLGNRGWTAGLNPWRSGALVLLIGLVGTILLIASGSWFSGVLTALLLPVVSVALWTAIPGPDAKTWNPTEYKLALVDTSHRPLFDGMAWEDRSIGGLEFNLMRNGFIPYSSASPEMLDEYPVALYVIFAPTTPLSIDMVDRVERYVENGGWAIVSAGWNLEPNVRPLLTRFGLHMRNIPLGQTGGTAFADSVQLADGYPIEGDGPDIEPIIECFGYTPARIVRRGKGGLVAIGDSQFFYNKNLEGQDNFVVMENVDFIRNLVNHIEGSQTP